MSSEKKNDKNFEEWMREGLQQRIQSTEYLFTDYFESLTVYFGFICETSHLEQVVNQTVMRPLND